LHVECSNTLFRHAYEFTEPTKHISIPVENLNDTVEVNVFIRAVKDLSGYKVVAAHADYNGAKFQVRTGDILAVGEGYTFHVESNFDSLSRIGSIMQIEESPNDGDLPLTADYNGDKIRIILSKADFKDYKILKGQEGISSALTSMIVVPVLVEALHVWKQGDSADEEDSLRWMRALRSKMTALYGRMSFPIQ
jgi:hypothetical protein